MQPAPPGFSPVDDALFLDFDGTLVHIAPRPDAVEVPPGLGPLLVRLHDHCDGAVALVSGRAIRDIAAFLPDWPGLVIGSHGAEWQGIERPPQAEPHLPLTSGELDDLHDAVGAFAQAEGLLCEPKPHGVALHFRNRPEAEDAAGAFMQAMADRYPGLVVQPAKMAFELRPRGATKDTALMALVRLPPFAGRRPVYLGDDRTDEPALEWVQDHGGLAIKVGEGATAARHRLPHPDAVLAWLLRGVTQAEGVAQ